jgi:hypothetical protein
MNQKDHQIPNALNLKPETHARKLVRKKKEKRERRKASPTRAPMAAGL